VYQGKLAFFVLHFLQLCIYLSRGFVVGAWCVWRSKRTYNARSIFGLTSNYWRLCSRHIRLLWKTVIGEKCFVLFP